MRGLGLPERDQLAGSLRLVAEDLRQPGDGAHVGLEVEGVAADDGFPAQIPAAIHFLEVVGQHFADLRHADLHGAFAQHVEEGVIPQALQRPISGVGVGIQEGRDCLDDALSASSA